MNDILVVGVLNTGNLGDDLIYEMVFQTCKKAYHKEPLTLNIGNTKEDEDNNKIGNKKAFLKKIKNTCSRFWLYRKCVEIKRLSSLNKTLDALDFSTIDTIVFAGGQLLFNYFIPLLEVIVRRAESNAIKVILNACGVGPVSGENVKKLREIIESNSVEMITLRESPKLLWNVLGNAEKQEIQRVNDPALQCASRYKLCPNSRNTVGIGLIDPITLQKHNLKISKNEYEMIIKIMVSYCDEKNLAYEFFCTGDKRDYAFLCEMQKNLYPDSAAASRPKSVQELIELINKYSSIVSFRLHSHIVAASYGIPSFALVWDEKVKEFLKGIERENDCFDLTKERSLENFETKLDFFFQEEYHCNLKKFEDANDVLYAKLVQKKEMQT